MKKVRYGRSIVKPWAGLGSRIITAIQDHQKGKLLNNSGALGDFYRGGGNDQLYTGLPLDESDLVLDVGGYHGEWTAGIVARYGCRSELFEPVPAFVEICRHLFEANTRVRLHQSALGAVNRVTRFSLSDTVTSEFIDEDDASHFEAQVIGISEYLHQLVRSGRVTDTSGAIGCLKLNVEGGEYEVLEQLLFSGEIEQFRSLLIQFHRQPACWKQRYETVTEALKATHERIWCYPMVWERWDHRS